MSNNKKKYLKKIQNPFFLNKISFFIQILGLFYFDPTQLHVSDNSANYVYYIIIMPLHCKHDNICMYILNIAILFNAFFNMNGFSFQSFILLDCQKEGNPKVIYLLRIHS